MRVTRLLPIVLLAAGVSMAENTAVVHRSADHLTLGNGENVDVIGFSNFEPGSVASTSCVRDYAGTVLSITMRHDMKWDVHERILRANKEVLTMRVGAGFLEDGLPQPFEVRIGDKVYRTLAGKPTENQDAWRRIYLAVGRLPVRFTSALKTAYVAADSSAGSLERSGLPASVILVGYLFEEEIPRVPVLASVPMKPAEVESLRAQAVQP